MDDIAKELGMSKKTIYQFYKEKDDLVNQLCEIQLSEQTCQFNELNDTALDPIHEIMMISLKMREMIQHVNPMFFLDLQKFYPRAYKQFQKFREDCAYRNIHNNITRGIEMGVYRSDLDADFVTNYRLVQIDMLMFGNYYTFDKISFVRTHELVLDMFVYGICTLKGHQLINSYKKINEAEE
jgi:AcrR family transcriptional regulator